MVSREATPEDANSTSTSPAPPRVQDMRPQLWSADSDESIVNPWRNGAQNPQLTITEPTPTSLVNVVPDTLRPGPAAATGSGAHEEDEEQQNAWRNVSKVFQSEPPSEPPSGQKMGDVPDILRPGPKSQTNPFLKKMAQGSSAATNTSPPAVEAPMAPPTGAFSDLSLVENTRNPWESAQEDSSIHPDLSQPPVPADEATNDPWASAMPSRQPSTTPASNSPALLSMPSEEEPPNWDDQPTQPKPPPVPMKTTNEEAFDDHIWDDLGALDKGKGPASERPIAEASASPPGDDWDLVDGEPRPGQLSKQDTLETFADAEETPALAPLPKPAGQPPPELPPRRSGEDASRPPPTNARPGKTTYNIKNINWHDKNARQNPRKSPILVQNENGPCPLVALVNALTLTAPPNVATPLTETLRTREQISLGYLLEALMDELMDGRRATAELPDVGDLFAFLQTLDTGMNVNPRFIPTPENITAHKRTSLTHIRPMAREDIIPGTFEDTKEMKLYGSFSVPLVHGWLPSQSDDVYDAFNRRAVFSYEDAQNFLFRKEELEEKLSNPAEPGLTEDEQEIYQDVLMIDSFLGSNATQLTPWGLDVVTKAVKPGTVAIFFRNDHFSTLYRHPDTSQLFALVTDAGYASHQEVIWESLVDINGEKAEFLSGDFRVVGGAQYQNKNAAGTQPGSSNGQGSSAGSNSRAGDGGGEWTTVQGGRRSRGQDSQGEAAEGAQLSPTEQADRDFALALQLQEEEDERNRAEEERRRRESQLSEQYIEQQGRQPGPNARANNNGSGGAGGGRFGEPVPPGRQSSNGISNSVTTHGRGRSASANTSRSSLVNRAGAGGTGSAAAATATAAGTGASPRIGQVVRPLVPPARSAARVNRASDDGLEDAPPSYEQAASEAAFDPPEGHPSHPASSPQAASAASAAGAAPSFPSPPTRTNTIPTTAGMTGYPPNGPGRRPVPMAMARPSMYPSGRDRDCVVM